MLLRAPTRIEFKVEDAQEYIRQRERQRQALGPGVPANVLRDAVPQIGRCAAGGPTGPLPPLPGATAYPPGAPPESCGSSSGQGSAAGLLQAPPGSAAPPRPAGPSDAVSPDVPMAAPSQPLSPQAMLHVEQLVAMGFTTEQAKRALMSTNGDVEAAADWLLQ
mmetsp:Transcript_28285/g.65617  ORF Transcript_28285/g.65617 Transcript_28285/m.65617 type:complete len:163 (-) Transcript_28285:100-588(-)